jgi:hypothetical protein
MKMNDFDITPNISQVSCELCGHYAMPDAPLCVRHGKVVCEVACEAYLRYVAKEEALDRADAYYSRRLGF